jgi:hypothetical protein
MNDENHNPIYGDPFQALLDHFEAVGIRYSCKREERRIWFSMNSGNAVQKCRFNFDKTGDVLQIFIEYPVMVKEPFRAIAAEFITRANYGLVVGNFEMDWKDGEVRFHASHVMPEGKLEDGMIRRLFGTALGTADRYYPALMQVLYAGTTPEDAVYLAELDYHAAHVEEPTKKGRKVSKDAGSKAKSSGKTKAQATPTSVDSGSTPAPTKKKSNRKGTQKPLSQSEALQSAPEQPLQKPQDPDAGISPVSPTSQSDVPTTEQGNEGEERKAA